MKMKLILNTVAVMALAVSADAHAMMRRSPVRLAAPRVSSRSFSFKPTLPKDVTEILAKVDRDRENSQFHQALKEVRENTFPLPEVPRQMEKLYGILWKTKTRWDIEFKHHDLCFDWYFANKRYLESKKDFTKEALKTGSSIGLPLITGKLFADAPNEITASLFVATFFYSVFRNAFKLEFLWDDFKEFKAKKIEKMTVEEQLADLLADQKRELKLRDDIQ